MLRTVLRTLLAALGLWLAAGACVRAGRAAAVQPAPAPGPLLPVGVPAPAPAPRLSFNVSSFGNGDTVSVTWSVPSADDVQLGRTDMVALFLANASNPLHNEPIKYKWAAASEGHLASGTGSHTYAAWPQSAKRMLCRVLLQLPNQYSRHRGQARPLMLLAGFA